MLFRGHLGVVHAKVRHSHGFGEPWSLIIFAVVQPRSNTPSCLHGWYLVIINLKSQFALFFCIFFLGRDQLMVLYHCFALVHRHVCGIYLEHAEAKSLDRAPLRKCALRLVENEVNVFAVQDISLLLGCIREHGLADSRVWVLLGYLDQVSLPCLSTVGVNYAPTSVPFPASLAAALVDRLPHLHFILVSEHGEEQRLLIPAFQTHCLIYGRLHFDSLFCECFLEPRGLTHLDQ